MGSKHGRGVVTERELKEFLILRLMDEPVTQAERERASGRSVEALDVVREDGHAIEWVDSQILETDDGEVTGTLCHFRADTEDALRQHAECAGLPVTQVYRRGRPVEGPHR